MEHKKRDFIIPIVIFLITCLIVGLIIIFTTNGKSADKPSTSASVSASVSPDTSANANDSSASSSADATEFTVTFVTLDGTPIPAQTVVVGECATIPTETVVRNGYNFDGWDFDFTTPITANTVITAKWTAIEYNITYVLGDGINNPSNPSTYTIESGAITLLAPTKIGYDFLSWSDGGVIPAGSTGDVTFTANYEIIEYTITYVLGSGGINDASNPSTYTIESGVITLLAPTRTGYDFAGWSDGGVIPLGSTGDKTLLQIGTQ